METQANNEISRESLVKILEILQRLATPEAMPELLREIIEVGKVAIVAEAGVLWLLDRGSGKLVMVAPSDDQTMATLQGWAGNCLETQRISNIHECRDDELFRAYPIHISDFETRSLLNVPIIGHEETPLGVMQWLGKKVGQFDKHDEWVGPALAAQAAVAIEHSYLTDELLADAIIKKEVAAAREIQMSTLPSEMPVVDGYDLHGHFLPTDHTGGDLYDLVVLDNKLFILLGDATGHGFGPALSATQLQAMLRVAFRLGADLNTAYEHVNNQLNEDLPDDRFITAFIGFLDPMEHCLGYHSAGQGPILHFNAKQQECVWHKPTSFPMGIMDLDAIPHPQRLILEPGDILALLSDGIYEYTNPKGKEFGEERVAEVLKRKHTSSMKDLSESLIEAVFEFGGDAPQADDITLVLVKRLGNTQGS